MAETKSAARIYGILAPEANQLVILRRGPEKHTLMMVWDLSKDVIIPGQWIVGTVAFDRCDVSPDGRYFVAKIYDMKSAYFRGLAGKGNESSYTLISRPPYFTALAIWFKDLDPAYQKGGGIWRSNCDLTLYKPDLNEADLKQIPTAIRTELTPLVEYATFCRMIEPKMRDGWERLPFSSGCAPMTLDAWIDKLDNSLWEFVMFKLYRKDNWRDNACFVWEKVVPGGLCRLIDLIGDEVWQLLDKDGAVIREWTVKERHGGWLEVDASGALLYSENGFLYRWGSFPDGEPQMVADLNPYTFAPVAAPDWAKEW